VEGKRRRTVISSYEDLEVYQKLLELHLEVNTVTLQFPRFERFELGSQLRRSSNSIAANIAEGWNNKHLNVYLQAISRAFGELQETRHHLTVAHRKGYLSAHASRALLGRYAECASMLRGLERSLKRYADRKRPMAEP
jgi:four helix bundle protein